MAILPIRHWPDEVLRRKAEPVDPVDAGTRRILSDMAETMYAANGVGLAGPQVGLSLRVVTIDVPGDEESDKPGRGLLYLVNPRLLSREGACKGTEGCLSFPGLEIEVKRSARVRLAYQDGDGVERTLDVDGLLAVCVQHELDHLDGIVFTDRLGPVSRRLALREYDRGLSEAEEPGDPR
jgi:peptide deformylase